MTRKSKVNSKSKKTVVKKRMEQEQGISNDGTPYSNPQLDVVVEMWLAGDSEKKICKVLGRSLSSIQTIVWKICERYNGLTYVPGNRKERIGLLWNARGLSRELDMLHHCLSKEWGVSEIALLLARTEEEVRTKILELRGYNRQGFFPTDSPCCPEIPDQLQVTVNDVPKCGKECDELEGLKPVTLQPISQHEGSKYLRTIKSCVDGATAQVDVYDVLTAFNVESQAVGHAVKKLLCAGIRGKGDIKADLIGAIAAINRAIELAEE